MISRHANYTLHKVLLRIHRIMEHNDVPARDLLIRHHMVANPGSAIAQLVDEQIVPNQQGILHRLRGNLEGLHDESDHEDRYHHRAHQRLQRSDHIAAEGGYDMALRRLSRRTWWNDREIQRAIHRRWRNNRVVERIHEIYLSTECEFRAVAFPS